MNFSLRAWFSLCFNFGSGVKLSKPKLKQNENSTIVLIFDEKPHFLFSFDHFDLTFFEYFYLCIVFTFVNFGSRVKLSEPKLKQNEKSTIVLIFHEKPQFLFSFDHFNVIFFEYFFKCMVFTLLQFWFRGKVI